MPGWRAGRRSDQASSGTQRPRCTSNSSGPSGADASATLRGQARPARTPTRVSLSTTQPRHAASAAPKRSTSQRLGIAGMRCPTASPSPDSGAWVRPSGSDQCR
jgi:hypothetical protein